MIEILNKLKTMVIIFFAKAKNREYQWIEKFL